MSEIREIPASELHTIYPMVSLLNPIMTHECFTELFALIKPRGYRAVGAYENDILVGICGFIVAHRFWCGKHLDLDSFVVDPAHRNKGIGEKIFAWLEAFAINEKCTKIGFDAYTHNTPSHRFYHRQGYIIEGYHFTKDLRTK